MSDRKSNVIFLNAISVRFDFFFFFDFAFLMTRLQKKKKKKKDEITVCLRQCVHVLATATVDVVAIVLVSLSATCECVCCDSQFVWHDIVFASVDYKIKRRRTTFTWMWCLIVEWALITFSHTCVNAYGPRLLSINRKRARRKRASKRTNEKKKV